MPGPHSSRSLPTIRALGWRSTVADVLVHLADVARAQGDSWGGHCALHGGTDAIYRQVREPPLVASDRLGARPSGRAWPWSRATRSAAQTHVTEMLVIARDADQAGMREITGALEAQAALATGRVGAPELAGALEVAAALASVQNTPLRAAALGRGRGSATRPPPATVGRL